MNTIDDPPDYPTHNHLTRDIKPPGHDCPACAEYWRQNTPVSAAPVAHHFPRPAFEYAASIRRWVDGDTVDLSIDLGFHVWTNQRCRLLGIDTPERGQVGYNEARLFAERFAPVGPPVLIRSEPPADKYGRFLVDIILADGSSLNHLLIDAGLARPYNGGTR